MEKAKETDPTQDYIKKSVGTDRVPQDFHIYTPYKWSPEGHIIQNKYLYIYIS